MSRRLFRLSLALVALLAVVLGVLYADDPADPPQQAIAAPDCRLSPGDQTVGGALLHVPKRGRTPLPLVLAFHGAGGTGRGMADSSGLSQTADRHGFAV